MSKKNSLQSSSPSPLFSPHLIAGVVLPFLLPNHQRWLQNESSVGTCCTRCIHVFARSAPVLYAQLVLIDKNFCIRAQEEVYQKCVVCWVRKVTFFVAFDLFHSLQKKHTLFCTKGKKAL